MALRRFDEALAALEAAIADRPGLRRCALERGADCGFCSAISKGLGAREWGRNCRGFFVDRNFTKPHWLGEEPIAGKTILLHSDEGLGDTIQYVRYAKLVAQLGARVILEVQDPFIRCYPASKALRCACQDRRRAARFRSALSAFGLAVGVQDAARDDPVRRCPICPAPPETRRAGLGARGSARMTSCASVWSGPAIRRMAMTATARCRLRTIVQDPRCRCALRQPAERPASRRSGRR